MHDKLMPGRKRTHIAHPNPRTERHNSEEIHWQIILCIKRQTFDVQCRANIDAHTMSTATAIGHFLFCVQIELTSTQRQNIKCYFDRLRSTFFEFLNCGLCALASRAVVSMSSSAVRLGTFRKRLSNLILPCIGIGIVKLNSHSCSGANEKVHSFASCTRENYGRNFSTCVGRETRESIMSFRHHCAACGLWIACSKRKTFASTAAILLFDHFSCDE